MRVNITIIYTHLYDPSFNTKIAEREFYDRDNTSIKDVKTEMERYAIVHSN